jgi:hypothetical protein
MGQLYSSLYRIGITAVLLAFALGSLTAAEPTASKVLTWTFREDFRSGKQRENPNSDRLGQPTWFFLRTTNADGPIATRQWLRDGKYVLLTEQGGNLFGAPLDGWAYRAGKQRLAPLVARVTAPYDVGLQFKPGDITIAPGPDHAIIVGWRSPVAGVLEIEGVFEHAQNCCGVNSQIAWYLERGPSPNPMKGFQPLLLASGKSDFGSTTQRGVFHIKNQKIQPGEFLYFIVDAIADGTGTVHHGDGTRFDVTLTVRNAKFPPPPSFEKDILPILARSCHECHGAETQESQLDLRTLAAMLRGGDNGPAIVRGHPERSYLIDLISRGEMPPDENEKLSPDQLALLRRWIKAGTPAEEKVGKISPRSFVSAEDRKFWAFNKPIKRALPKVQQIDRVRSPIDRFVLEKLATKGLSFSPDVDRVTLLRRAYFDLIGLPPTPAEIDAFLNDTRPDAYERLLQRLLESPHYGERWGRHWLDAAGFVDVRLFDGDLATIYLNEGMSRYRDYVIRAFNADKPWDRFITEQLAGDELADWKSAETFTPEIRDLLVATSFLRNIEDPTSEPQYGVKQRYDVLFDLMQTVSTSLLGLTMECSRCHNHKYDPISQRDYFRLMSCFESAYNVNDWLKPQQRWLADVSPAERQTIDQLNKTIDGETAGLQKELKSAEKSKNKKKADELKSRIAKLNGSKRSYGRIQALWDVGQSPQARLMRRGNYKTPGISLEPGFLEVLSTPNNLIANRPPDTRQGSSGRRLALARWMTSREHPLTARVIVNRAWHHHFSVGIVATPGNFGHSGAGATHPELLDWLAVDFMEHGWSLKRLHKQIMTSTVYRQSSRRPQDPGAGSERVDPENKLLWRMNLKRLEAEIVRDAILAVSGKLDRTAGGPPVMITKPSDGLSMVVKGATPTSHRRRSIYLLARRVYPLKFLEVFDAPIMPINCTKRANSATVLQSFTFLNGPFVIENAAHLAERVLKTSGDEPARQIETAYRLALSRQPTASEIRKCRAYLDEQTTLHAGDKSSGKPEPRKALADLCHMLLSTNEFLYVE